jgi:hypothetical protein
MTLCEEYLVARGISQQTATAYGLELDEHIDVKKIKTRLSLGFQRGYNEVLWFPLRDATGNVLAWIARPLPTMANHPKFYCPVGSSGIPFVPQNVYQLPFGKPLIITEGPAKALVCVQAGVDTIGINGVWGASVQNTSGLYVIRADLQKALDWRGRKVYFAFDADCQINPDVRHALFRLFFILSCLGAETFQLTNWPCNEGKGIDDYLVNRLQANGQYPPEQVLQELLASAKPFVETVQAAALDLGLVCSELRKVHIPEVLRSQLCKQLAGPLGVRVSALEEGSSAAAEVAPDKRGRLEETIEPWPEPVDGAALLQKIFNQVHRFVVIDDNGYTVLCLHVLLAYCWELFQKLPILRIKSPVKRCGKSTVLDVIELLVSRPLLTVSLSPAALYRIIEKFHPYVMIDEADSFGEDNDELRIIVNGGFERGRPAIRVNKETLEPEFFDTFGPKVLASIGALHDTIEDRSIIIEMKRKPPGIDVEELCDADLTVFIEIRRQVMRWFLDNLERLKATKLPRPKALVDRAWNKWRPLLTIAHVVGDIWPAVCLQAAIAISGASDEERSIAVEVLIRIRAFFKDREQDVLAGKKGAFGLTTDVLSYLNLDKEAPWADWQKGDNKGLTSHKLGRILKPFKIKSDQTQIDNKHVRGYWFEDFAETFQSYLAPEEPDKNQGDCA